MTEKDPLDRLAKAGARDIIALMLWQNRFNNPSLSVQLTQRDLEGLEKCVQFQKLQAEVVIMRPKGRPAQDPIPASPGRMAIPGRPADPPRPFVVVALVVRLTRTGTTPFACRESIIAAAAVTREVTVAEVTRPFSSLSTPRGGR